MEDLDKKKKAARTFVNMFGGSFVALSISDTDFKIFDSKKKLIAYAEVVIVDDFYDISTDLIVKIQSLLRLSNKRLNPVVIWAFNDGIVYSKVTKIQGLIKWGSPKGKPSLPSTMELIADYKQNKNFKYERY
ncbi:hypothetical protein N8289_04190 [Flavobacteriales bacterium]|nr:hypothetical protein [bacterium]MDC1371021.1 hypothetical protein [Flavobacteriales bacterium]|tara:strand:- start:6180 stop:6575 length:396 start_codon:yes stop_codon:yes gene_type:complete